MEGGDLKTPRDVKGSLNTIQLTMPRTLHKEHNKLSIANWPDVVFEKIFRVVDESRWDSLELLKKENEALKKQLKCRICLPATPVCPNDPKGIKKWLREREEELREEYRMLETLHRIICRAIRLFIVLCMSIVSNCRKKPRLKNRYEKVVILILWRCGDIERNPGPPISDITRDFCKKMISLLVIKYWESKEGGELCHADYKRKPARWPEHNWYGDPSSCKNETRNIMLKCLREICLAEEIGIPYQWLTLIDKYQTLLRNGCDKSQKKQYADEMNSWLNQLRFLETADQLFDRLPSIPDQKQNSVLHLFKKLKQYVPDLTSESLQSLMIENNSTATQSREGREITTNTVLADKGTSKWLHQDADILNGDNINTTGMSAANRGIFCNIPGAGVHNIFIQEAHTPCITESCDFDCNVDLFGEISQTLTAGSISNLPESDTINHITGSKRKLDVYGEGDQGQLIPSKRQTTSLEFNVLHVASLTNDTSDEDWETKLANVTELVESEMNTNLDDNSPSNWVNSGQDRVVSDTEPSALMQELEGYLSDEFINELSKNDGLQSGIATNA